MSGIIFEFLDYAEKEYGIKILESIKADGVQHRYKTEGDKGAAKTTFVTFYLDENPMAVFGNWKLYDSQTFKWYYRDQNELSNKELKEHQAKMRERAEKQRLITQEKNKQAAIRSGQLWSQPDLGNVDYPYLALKKCGAHGVKFFDNLVAFEYFASDERKEMRANGEIEVYPGPVMVVPVQNQNNQLVSLQQISVNGKFKGFMPDGVKKGGYHVMHGDETIVFLAEGYATGATIHELTGCTTYIAFDCGNLDNVAAVITNKHLDSVRIVASDNDRFTLKPVKNPGQKKALDICDKFGFYNLKPLFHDGQDGTDWNDLLQYYSFEVLKDYMMNRLQVLFDTYNI